MKIPSTIRFYVQRAAGQESALPERLTKCDLYDWHIANGKRDRLLRDENSHAGRWHNSLFTIRLVLLEHKSICHRPMARSIVVAVRKMRKKQTYCRAQGCRTLSVSVPSTVPPGSLFMTGLQSTNSTYCAVKTTSSLSNYLVSVDGRDCFAGFKETSDVFHGFSIGSLPGDISKTSHVWLYNDAIIAYPVRTACPLSGMVVT